MVFAAYVLENGLCYPGVGHLQPILSNIIKQRMLIDTLIITKR